MSLILYYYKHSILNKYIYVLEAIAAISYLCVRYSVPMLQILVKDNEKLCFIPHVHRQYYMYKAPRDNKEKWLNCKMDKVDIWSTANWEGALGFRLVVLVFSQSDPDLYGQFVHSWWPLLCFLPLICLSWSHRACARAPRPWWCRPTTF